MARFGTDGVRGLANRDLTAELALDLAVAAAHILSERGNFASHRPKAIVGQDSRASGSFLEAAVVAGLASAGVDVYRVGILPTPAIAHLVAESSADLGVMISASHNPMPDNGIKFFARGGGKLDDALEAAIEARLGEPWDRPLGGDVGRVIDDQSALERYIFHLLKSVKSPLHGIKLVVDCANGASSEAAPEVYRRAGAEVIAIHAAPNGLNINDGCGSTHLDDLIAKVKASGADLGIAHDGDADRALAVDGDGNVIDGDFIMAILANHWLAQNRLVKKSVVATVMSNLGFMKSMQQLGINVPVTQVGDRYVLEEINNAGFVLGGEQSGHIILREHASTGDGLLTALALMQVMAESKKSLHELAKVMQRFPQVMLNVSGVDLAGKAAFKASPTIAEKIALSERELGSAGRVLVRASGTEPIIRVMVEAQSGEIAAKHANEIAALVRFELNL